MRRIWRVIGPMTSSDLDLIIVILPAGHCAGGSARSDRGGRRSPVGTAQRRR
uniref:Uncharacterized protein n=1 Tax=Arundo donax TaxID=35708 RepID=A0A0A8Z6K3_ARUDO